MDETLSQEALLQESLLLRDPLKLLQQVRQEWERAGRGDLWVFGYGSLIWRPEFEAEEHRPAQVHGYHRALRMRSRINRGTPERPGLVYALVPGGCCRGMAYRLAAARVEDELPRLWAREMPTGVYDPRWLQCRTASGTVRALAFTLSRRSPNYTGQLSEEEILEVLRHARGRYGSTMDYLLHTATALRRHGMADRESEKLLALARRHRLIEER
ncbi:gamma-glutamylcyclotransferase [Azohydromonas lata]|uniref:glutathione-specific gamma-glutamylcyclotransferase n=1 Tax=Azohydromonas lata TaxID=45677 RepID=A0ABU5IL71_9BURK|nr:gamma-glutamylcyclotransferase [Azohydromonas lata]MDZ5459636.1 gamma-glutamylcyclotransferase [Azohydromonas lata]